MKAGNCYENSAEWVLQKGNDQFNLVHGICTHAKDLVRMGHAWAEHASKGFVYDVSTGLFLNKEMYYRLGVVSDTVVYSCDEVEKMMLKEMCYGPWDEKIKKAPHN